MDYAMIVIAMGVGVVIGIVGGYVWGYSNRSRHYK